MPREIQCARGFVIKLPKVRGSLYLGMFVMILKVLLSSSCILPYSDTVDTVLSFLSACLFAVHILIQNYSLKVLLIYTVIMLASLYSSLKVGDFALFITVITCLAIRSENIGKILDFMFKYEMVFLLLHTSIAIFMGVFFNVALTVESNYMLRYHFGMRHPNEFSIYLFQLMILWVFLNFEKIKAKHICILISVSGVAYLYTKTRTSLLAAVFLCAALFLEREVPELAEKVLKEAAMFAIPSLFVLTMALVFGFAAANPAAFAIDRIFSARFRLGAFAYVNYGWTWFGQRFSYVAQWDPYYGLSAFTFDNIYTYLAIRQGLAWIVLIASCFFLLAKKGIAKVNLSIIVWALYGMSEVNGINGYLCFPIFLVVLLLQEKQRANIA